MPNFATDEGEPRPQAPWYLKEWMAVRGKKQTHLQSELGWSRGNANALFHGRTRYHQDTLAEAAAWLGIEPYELLMSPTVAMSMRRLRQSAEAIVSDRPGTFTNDLEGLLPSVGKGR
jgi:hypothetical protein